MVSFRGLLAVAVGSLFLAFGVAPGAFGEDPPTAIRALMVVTGLTLEGLGLYSIIWVQRRHRTVLESEPEHGMAVLDREDTSEATAYTLHLTVGSQRWSVGAVNGRGLAGVTEGTPHPARIWRDGPDGPPLAVEINGAQINTLPRAVKTTG